MIMQTGSTEAIFAAQGFGKRLGLHGKLGLLVVDFCNGFADAEIFGGGNIGTAIQNTVPLLALARASGWPVAHSRIVFEADGSDGNIFSLKVPSLLTLTENAHASAIVPELAPESGEFVVRKKLPSAFFGTTLSAWYAERAVQTLVVAGCVTSGCVRASVIDSMCHGFRPVVVADCVGDRAIAPHEASLFDMAQKYADVVEYSQLLLALEV